MASKQVTQIRGSRATSGSNAGGFTLIELMVVVAVIGILAQIVAANTGGAIERAKVVRAAAEVQLMQKVVSQYRLDTGQYPPNCDWGCGGANDPFMNSLGVKGWAGPYIGQGSRRDPWGGHITVITNRDIDGDGQVDCTVVLDDDVSDPNDNAGQIPTRALKAIDKILDDGDLTTGVARADGLGFLSVPGELSVRCSI